MMILEEFLPTDDPSATSLYDRTGAVVIDQ